MKRDPLPPGSTIGILGGGQLGRMVALAAARLGFHCHVLCPDPASPAFEVAAAHTVAAYEDADALAALAAAVDVVTYEFENVPAETAHLLSAARPLFPDARALAITQDRVAEKAFLVEAGVAVAPFAAVDTAADLGAAIAVTGLPAILKTRRFGYDGKGQAKVATRDAAVAALDRLAAPCILEGLVPFALEVSAIVVRGQDGGTAVYEIGENRHENHILATTTIPAAVDPATLAAARALGCRIAHALGYVGVLGVEMFVVRGPDGAESLLVNELAPRVHNSGHWTEDGAITSQFENHVRAIAGWPLGSVESLGRAEMRNLIGDEAADWHAIVSDPAARLHLYGKAEARPGRKMGHVNRVWPRP
ncbi:5-(carboxyamino)imidazole ribonucleotide synthase [Mongoliimonas terrestris]|uniref:5-(carboxyamino)imidazole ribonucleotide synthase n=1 Tax=Mongoliimonas terrestris TaxID=1709001 RepID=UPI0009FB28D6|nr:5-(carboxyamino)imidazole ribonucleotide synthase [Mongoliimonas terrestris]